MQRLRVVLDNFLHRRDLVSQLVDLGRISLDGVIGSVELLCEDILLRCRGLQLGGKLFGLSL